MNWLSKWKSQLTFSISSVIVLWIFLVPSKVKDFSLKSMIDIIITFVQRNTSTKTKTIYHSTIWLQHATICICLIICTRLSGSNTWYRPLVICPRWLSMVSKVSTSGIIDHPIAETRILYIYIYIYLFLCVGLLCRYGLIIRVSSVDGFCVLASASREKWKGKRERKTERLSGIEDINDACRSSWSIVSRTSNFV